MDYTAIVILNYNNYKDTTNCINSVLKHNTAEIKFFVVDNGSPNEECVPSLEKYFKQTFSDDYLCLNFGQSPEVHTFPKLTFIISNTNDGYACGNNKALKYIKNDKDAKYILILNNDILFVQDIIPELVENLNVLNDTAIVSPLLLKKDGCSIDYNCARRNTTVNGIILSNLGLAFHIHLIRNRQHILIENPEEIRKEKVEIELPSGSCMLIKSELFFKLGCFDPKTFLYYEENILFKKTSSLGLRNYLIPSLHCIHLGAQSTKKRRADYKFFIHSYKSQIYYVKKYSGANCIEKMCYKVSLVLAYISKYCSNIIKKTLHIK